MSRNYMVIMLPDTGWDAAAAIGHAIMGKVPAVFLRVLEHATEKHSYLVLTFDNEFSEDAQNDIIDVVIETTMAHNVLATAIGPGIKTLISALEFVDG